MMLLEAALVASEEVLIGVADGELLKNKKLKELLQPIEQRKEAVREFCKLQRRDLNWSAPRFFW